MALFARPISVGILIFWIGILLSPLFSGRFNSEQESQKVHKRAKTFERFREAHGILKLSKAIYL